MRAPLTPSYGERGSPPRAVLVSDTCRIRSPAHCYPCAQPHLPRTPLCRQQGRSRASDGHRPAWFPLDMPHHPCHIWIPPSRPFLLLPVLVVLAWIGLISAPEPPGQWRRGHVAHSSRMKAHSRPLGEKTSCFSVGDTVVCSVLGTPQFLWVEEKPGRDA